MGKIIYQKYQGKNLISQQCAVSDAYLYDYLNPLLKDTNVHSIAVKEAIFIAMNKRADEFIYLLIHHTNLQELTFVDCHFTADMFAQIQTAIMMATSFPPETIVYINVLYRLAAGNPYHESIALRTSAGTKTITSFAWQSMDDIKNLLVPAFSVMRNSQLINVKFNDLDIPAYGILVNSLLRKWQRLTHLSAADGLTIALDLASILEPIDLLDRQFIPKPPEDSWHEIEKLLATTLSQMNEEEEIFSEELEEETAIMAASFQHNLLLFQPQQNNLAVNEEKDSVNTHSLLKL